MSSARRWDWSPSARLSLALSGRISANDVPTALRVNNPSRIDACDAAVTALLGSSKHVGGQQWIELYGAARGDVPFKRTPSWHVRHI